MTEVGTVEEGRESQGRVGNILNRVEMTYLRILRVAILLLATALILYAAGMAVWSVYKISRSANSVIEKPAIINADDITDAALPAGVSNKAISGESKIAPAHRNFYNDAVKRYYTLFIRKFEPYRQDGDKKLSQDEFDDAFVGSEARMHAVSQGDLDFIQDKADLERLLAVMADASTKNITKARLEKYRNAKKVRVAQQVQKTRTEYRQGWNSSSTSCEDWYLTPYGCPERRSIETPYTETVYSLAYPSGTQSHTEIFRAFQDRFYSVLKERRDGNRSEAESQRVSILEGNAQGKVTLWTALQIVGGFIVLMFFFLLIAIERHQRQLAGEWRGTAE